MIAPTVLRFLVQRILVAALLPGLLVLAAAPYDDVQLQSDTLGKLNETVTPVLTRFCVPCHSGANAAAGIPLDLRLTSASLRGNLENYRKALRAITNKTMPPSGAASPSLQARLAASETLRSVITRIDQDTKQTDPGRVAPRRLNIAEYNNTIRELLKITITPADDFPPDSGGGGGFDNNADTLYLPPVLMERYLIAADAMLEAAPTTSWNLVKPSLKLSDGKAAVLSIRGFASLAFRRPVTPNDVKHLAALYQLGRSKRQSHLVALRMVIKAILVSPQFLFRFDVLQASKGPSIPVNAFELASRMSYFLWASMPDQELFALAKSGALLTRSVQVQQVKRMLSSPKASTLGTIFASQWLRSKEILQTAQPDPVKYPTITPSLRLAMHAEVSMFVTHAIQANEPIRMLIATPYTFLNEELARHYGVTGVFGTNMRRVHVDGVQRGGLLGMAALLTVTSYPLRTSPVLRGKWLLAELLGAPPPPPPPAVDALPADEKFQQGETLRTRLERHRKNPECKGCHQRIDPLGFSLENYDAVGRWRENIQGVPIDTLGELVTGEPVEGVSGLRRLLISRHEDVARNTVERLLSYAIGRGIEPNDGGSVTAIMQETKAGGFRLQDLMLGVVQSLPFRHKRPSGFRNMTDAKKVRQQGDTHGS